MEQNEKDQMNQTDDNLESGTEQSAEETALENATENTNSDTKDESNQSPNYEAKIAELNDKYLRLYSEFDNYRKRTIKEKSDIIRSAGEDVFKAIIPSIDDFERAIKANETVSDAEPIKEGIKLIYHKLKSACTQKGLEPIESIGKPFNVDIMESITNVPAPSDDMKGKVIDEVEKGYKLGDKVIRFAKVVVGS
ncbi:MAG: nucleotide exchange factor GrpE [Bacteroidota bacterium]|jgi:molecular chaperone GrpE|nr:nucleotide exchange factor GrpE [Bacteroidota bacterium]